jgi:hypothetical protein
MADTPEFNFTSAPRWGQVESANVPFHDFIEFCRPRRILTIIVKEGFYRCEFRQSDTMPPFRAPTEIPIVFSDADFEE